MLMLHPPIAPWVQAADDGLHLGLLVRDLGAAAAEVRVLRDNEEHLHAMTATGRDGRWTRCHAVVPWCDSSPATRYAFRVIADDRCTWLGAAGARPRIPRLEEHFRAARRSIVPPWAADQIVYEIFVDRFARGTSGPPAVPAVVHGSRPVATQTRAWGEPPADPDPAAVFYGGDLAGIEQRLAYLHEHLGVTALYLTPVFLAGSNHRYNIEDYGRVCPLLGGDAALVSLAEALRARGMRLLLDAVLNHTGTNHPWFNRWGCHPTLGAAQSPASPHAGWYARDAQGRVVGWNGHASLPVLDYANPEVVQAMVEGEDAVLRRWLRAPVRADGWRLDAVHMVGEGAGAAGNAGLVRRIRAAVKGERADAWLVGEHFGQADAWLQGDQEDSAMNYWGFTLPLWAWLAGRDVLGRPAAIDTPTFVRWLLEALAAVPYEVALAQWNVLGSHDTPRLLSVLGGDTSRLAAAFALQFAWPGVPCVYYGDEVGLEGGGDPDCRRCFPWDEAQWNRPLLDHVRRLAALRQSHEALRRGALQVLAHGDDWIAFARHTATSLAVVVVARAAVPDATAVPLDALPFDPARLDWTALDGGVSVAAGALRVALPRAGAVSAVAARR
jgi:alpha-glucosidase